MGYVSDVTEKVQKIKQHLEIVMQFPQHFTDNLSVAWYGIESFYYNEYDDNGKSLDNAKIKLAAAIRDIRHAINGEVKKEYNDYYFTATIKSPGYMFKLKAQRENVCHKVDTGTFKEVEEIDYDNAPKKKVMVPITVWECDSILSEVKP